MSDDIQHIDVDSDEWENTPKDLRNQVKKLQKALSERDQTITEFRGKETDRVLGDVLTAQGFKNPKRVQRDLLGEGIDPFSETAVKSWLEANGEDYARGDVSPAPPEQQQLNQDQQDWDRLNVGSSAGSPANVSKVDAVIGEITPEMDGAAVRELYRLRGI